MRSRISLRDFLRTYDRLAAPIRAKRGEDGDPVKVSVDAIRDELKRNGFFEPRNCSKNQTRLWKGTIKYGALNTFRLALLPPLYTFPAGPVAVALHL